MGEATSTRDRWEDAFMREIGNSFDPLRFLEDAVYRQQFKHSEATYCAGRRDQVEADAAIARGARGLDDMTVEAIARLILAQLEPKRG